jgi:hypothetical protein
MVLQGVDKGQTRGLSRPAMAEDSNLLPEVPEADASFFRVFVFARARVLCLFICHFNPLKVKTLKPGEIYDSEIVSLEIFPLHYFFLHII